MNGIKTSLFYKPVYKPSIIALFNKIFTAAFTAEAIAATNATHGHPLGRSQYKILLALQYFNGPTSCYYLNNVTGLNNRFTLPNCNLLKAAGMITEEADPKTGRPWFTITPKGVETLHILERNLPSKPPKHWEKFRQYSQIRLLKQQLNKKT
jgi:hypothetical protein